MLYSKLEIPKVLRRKEIAKELRNLREETGQPFIVWKQPDCNGRAIELLSSILPCEKNIIWYRLDYLDNEECTFLEYLKEALEQKMTGLQLGDLRRGRNLKEPFCYLKSMVDIICKVSEYIMKNGEGEEYVLVFDNFHEIENQVTYRMVQQIIDNRPEGMRVILITEGQLPQFIDRYMQNKTGCIVDEKSFKSEEAVLQSVRPSVQLTVSFFNGFHVRDLFHKEELCWRTKREMQLFAYLFSLHGRGVDRSTLLETLWNEEIPGTGVAMLHNMIYHIRKEMNRLGCNKIIYYEKKNIG